MTISPYCYEIIREKLDSSLKGKVIAIVDGFPRLGPTPMTPFLLTVRSTKHTTHRIIIV